MGTIKGNLLQILRQDDIYDLHLATLDLLGRGVFIDDDRVLRALESAGALVDYGRRKVKLPDYLVEECIRKSPSRLEIHGRDPKAYLRLEGKRVHTHNGGPTLYIRDLESNVLREGLVQDVRDTTRLMDALDNVDAIAPSVACSDVPPALVSIVSLKEMIENTLKPVYLSRISSAEEARYFIRMGVIASAGIEEFRKNPWPYPRITPISPLRFEQRITQAIRECALVGMPIGLLPTPISGASGPMTLAGTLVLQNAEVLTGLTIIQVLNPGCPVIYGARASTLDMRTAFTSWGNPEVGILGACAVQLAQNYHLPSDVYGLSTNAKLPDAQAGYEKALNGILPALTGANFISGMGMLGGDTSSYEQLVIDNEIFGMSFRTLRAPIFTIDDTTLALDVIEEVVNQEGRTHFLAQPHTREFFRKGEHLMPNYRVSERNSTEEWLKLGGKHIAERAREVAKEILRDHHPEPLDKDIREGLDNIVKQAYEEFLG